MVQRQGMQSQVFLGNRSIDHTADVLPEHRIVGQHGTFGGGFGAAGVDNLRQRIALQMHFRQGILASRQDIKVVHA